MSVGCEEEGSVFHQSRQKQSRQLEETSNANTAVSFLQIEVFTSLYCCSQN